MPFQLAELFVELKARDEGLNAHLDRTHQRITGWGVAVGTAMGSLAAKAIGAAASGISGFFADGIKGAVDLGETLSKVDAIFGEASGTITGAADEMAAKYGALKGPFIDAAASFGAVFKGTGFAKQQAAELGTQLAKLGMDMASFGNASNEEVFTALQAALRGEFDPLERFTVFLSAAKIEEEALRSGLAKNKNEIDDLAKKQATLNLIMRSTVDQQGDLERTADSSSNQWKKLTGAISNMSVELAGKLEPALNSILAVGNQVVADLSAGISEVGGTFDWFAGLVQEGAETVGFVWRNMGAIWEVTQLQAQENFANIVVGAQTLAENIGRIAGWIGRNWYELISDGVAATATAFQNFGENLGNLAYAVYQFFTNPTGGFDFEWKPLLDGFKATVEELPELAEPAWVDMGDEIDKVLEGVGKKEVERNERIAAAKKAASEKAAKADAAVPGALSKDKFKSERVDAADFSYKLRASILGGDDTQKKQLAAQEKTAKATQETADAVKKPRPAVLS